MYNIHILYEYWILLICEWENYMKQRKFWIKKLLDLVLQKLTSAWGWCKIYLPETGIAELEALFLWSWYIYIYKIFFLQYFYNSSYSNF